MPNCPRCHQPIKPQAITCPHCRLVLKAHGHPGIPVHRATGDTTLCDTCVYHEDDTCNFPQRPHAKECTLYQDISAPKMEVKTVPNQSFQLWFKRNLLWVVLLVLLLISFLITWV
ncbi:zinc ribbon domain-containing protein [Aerosakkonemataceae cyanobacterium BLCC-F154]|uniref:Zinc ribbon domain-containing protein n=1 Tax=Floridaenema fluviatile BLCC-F154 TaxID=3153640 RepID=A0ABV4YB95_9CYAN